MIDFDITEIRDSIKLLNPDIDIDSSYTFFYDETNNIKKFYVREEDFNYAFHSNFILGGVLHEGGRPKLGNLFEGLKLQANVKEVKLKHIAFGELEDCFKSNKLDIFLNRIAQSPLYIHYSSLNILYWSLVDIVDSALANSEIAMRLGIGFSLKLKNDLYSLCKREIEEVIKIFYHFKYPNIKGDDVIPFIKTLSRLFEEYEDDFELHFGLTSLKQILRESEKNSTLPFVMDKEDYILLKDLSQFYLRQIYLFKNSIHIFDKEASIEEILKEYQAIYNGIPITSFSFEDSKNDQLIQVSDVLMGLIGKMSSFINTNTPDGIASTISSFNKLQLTNLDNYLDLVNKSDRKNKAFLHNIDGMEEMQKLNMIFEMRGKNST